MIHRILLDPQGGESGGAPSVDPTEGFKALLSKHKDDALGVARELHAENYKLRQKNAALKAGTPPEGSVVLSGDDAKDWSKYRELGKPGDVRKSLDEGQQAVVGLSKLGRAEQYRKIAEVEGYKPSVFADLAERAGLDPERIEFRPSKTEKGKDGKAVTVAFVKGEGDETLLSEFVEQNWQDYKPALGGRDAAKAASNTPAQRPAWMPAILPTDSGKAPEDPVRQAQDNLAQSGIYAAGF